MSRTQPPLIDLDQLDRNRGAQLAAIDRIGERLPSGVARDGSKVSAAVMVALLRVFDSLTSEQRPWNWQGVAFWQVRAGLQSEKTVRRAVQALASFGLIEVRDGAVPGYLRRLSVRIVWTTVFTSGPLTQDAEDLALWSRRRTRQRRLFGANPVTPIRTQCPDQFGHQYRINSDTVTGSIRTPVPNSSICNPQRDPQKNPPIHPHQARQRWKRHDWEQGGWVGGFLDSVLSGAVEDEFKDQDTRRTADRHEQPLGRDSAAGEAAPLDRATADHPRQDRRTGAVGSRGVGQQPSAVSHQPSARSHTIERTTTDMTMATDPELLDMLNHVGCSNPGQTLKKAANVALCHTRESIRAILAYVLARGVESVSSIEHGILVEKPKRLFPFGGGAINNRLTDPAQRNNLPSDWRVSVCGIWQSRWNQVHPPGMPSGKRSTPSATPAIVQSLERSPEETARLIALTEAREARYGATVDALTVMECKSLLAGNAIYLAALSRWEGTGPKPSTLRGALKLALEARDTESP